VRSGTFRPAFKWFYWLFVVNFLLLMWYGAQEPALQVLGPFTVADVSKLSVVYYFAYFIVVLPLLGRFEKPRPLPNSISESVLSKPAAATT